MCAKPDRTSDLMSIISSRCSPSSCFIVFTSCYTGVLHVHNARFKFVSKQQWSRLLHSTSKTGTKQLLFHGSVEWESAVAASCSEWVQSLPPYAGVAANVKVKRRLGCSECGMEPWRPPGTRQDVPATTTTYKWLIPLPGTLAVQGRWVIAGNRAARCVLHYRELQAGHGVHYEWQSGGRGAGARIRGLGYEWGLLLIDTLY